MGLFEKIFHKPSQTIIQDNGNWQTLNAHVPSFRTRVGTAYESELVRSAIDAKARHISKLGVDIQGTAKPSMAIRLRKAPNEFSTWSQFLYRLSTILDMESNAIIVPIFADDGSGNIVGIYPIMPSMTQIVEYKGEPWFRYMFANGKTASIELSACGIMTRYQFDDDIFGTVNSALKNTLDLIDLQNQGIKEAITNGASYRFMAKVNNFTKATDLEKERDRFNETAFQGNGGGMLLFPNHYTDIKQIDSQPYVVDSTQMEYIRTNVFNYFGVNEKVLQNSAEGSALDAFFNGCIEPFSIQLSEVLTKMLFTPVEQAYGNKIVITANRLQYMSTSEKISMAKEMGDRGVMKIDEIRELLNLEPLEAGGDRNPIRGEYYFLNPDGTTSKDETSDKEEDENEN